ncbi:hypothetical protein IT084_06925 [Desulfallas sp. Bu1-1]|uniref:AMP-binding enzyme n=1 Tax=Desulfallas sp. Bu1-1 TaxID=2787620 RepID=UPI00189D1B15|nr:hypothetical protein [Desulfallas sp. Bu1-1]MBF7082710.1 hypothetical protein [Desulfallas sp. Bu1-1]
MKRTEETAGSPDTSNGFCSEINLIYVMKTEVTPEEIIQWSMEHMAAYKYPSQVEFRESLPASGTGKVLRRLLKEEEHNE